MKKSLLIKAICIFLPYVLFLNAGDFDDGISTYTDDSISGNDEVFKKGINSAYMKTLVNSHKAQQRQDEEMKVDAKGIKTDSKGNMYIDQDSKITPGTTVINAPRGGRDMEGNMVIDPNVKIPIGARVINAPEYTK